MGNAFHMDNFDIHLFYWILAMATFQSLFLISRFFLKADNNIPSDYTFSVFYSRNNSACTLLVYLPHILGYLFPLSAFISSLLRNFSIRLSSCAPTRIQQYNITATQIPAVAIISFILLHPFHTRTAIASSSYIAA